MKVSLFVTCLIDQIYPEVGISCVRLLERLGLEVQFDPSQTCCGQPAFNSGYQAEARDIVDQLLRTYCDSDVPIVVPSGSCAAMIKVFARHLYPSDSREGKRVKAVADRTWELSAFLVQKLGLRSTGSTYHGVVTYHDSCHLLRELGVRQEPRMLIQSVEGIVFREMAQSENCCGFGGTFSTSFPDISVAIGEEKLKQIDQTGADWVVASDMSCLMHLDGLLKRRAQRVRVLHLAQLLAGDAP